MAILTIVTQVGGLLWLLTYILLGLRKKKFTRIKKLSIFVLVYLLTTIFLVPPLAKLNGRVPLPYTKTGSLVPKTMLTPLLNRHYVKPKLKADLQKVTQEISSYGNFKNLHLTYLDANFPFIDGFPLLPHKSHDDGKKVDLSFYYSKEGKVQNSKPARSGYGVYVDPNPDESNYPQMCKDKGYWQYDFPKYLTLGTRYDLEFNPEYTAQLIKYILDKNSTHKVFIEPHLKTRMNLKNDKVRFQGCGAVRHDDHIHWQIN